jgi:Holliday junction resolvase
MVRKPKSEYEFRDQLIKQGWYTLLTGGSLSPADLIAIKKKEKLFDVKAFQVKETNKKSLYLNEAFLKEMKDFELTTGIHIQLAVKFKMGRGKKAVWKIVEPALRIKVA